MFGTHLVEAQQRHPRGALSQVTGPRTGRTGARAVEVALRSCSTDRRGERRVPGTAHAQAVCVHALRPGNVFGRTVREDYM
jgi:hypothetical protein